jgi:hypothetical protein
MPLSDYPAWELEPRKLSSEEIADPSLVIASLFDFAHLPQVRAHLWELFKTLVAGNYPELKRREKTDFIILYEKLEKLIEAAHIIHRGKRTE